MPEVYTKNQVSTIQFSPKIMITTLDFFLSKLGLLKAGNNTDAFAIGARLQANDLQVVNHAFVVTRSVGGQNYFNLFETSDPRKPSITNVSNAKPDADQMMLITGIQLLAVTHTTTITEANLKTLNFGSIKAVEGLANGTLILKSGGKNIVNLLPLWKFVKDGSNQEVGLYDELHNQPKFIYPNQEIEANIELGAALPANTAVKILIHGLATSK